MTSNLESSRALLLMAMRILFDIVHPAHVHFFKHMISGLEDRGHLTIVLARERDVTHRLLEELGIPYYSVGRPSRWGRVGQVIELIHRDLSLVRLIRRFRADIVVTRNPAGVQAARLAGAVGIFDTDDGTAAGIHFHTARPFAHLVTSPDCLPEDFGSKHRRYPGYKQSAYLHPDHFRPDPSVREELGLTPDEPYSIVRFVAMTASHDSGETGMPLEAKQRVVERLQTHGRVFLSSESRLPLEWQRLAFRLSPSRMHDALAFADLVVGDSQTMTAEAAVLGTPALRASTFAGRISYLQELEHRYGLTWAFLPQETQKLMDKMDELLLSTNAAKLTFRKRKDRLFQDKVNVAKWFVDFIESQDRG